ncbi:MAG: 4-alpha-glucanotransferase [Gammaproteobacteria bacterium]|nr:4-alpha-glucanotransferase [Gammaproteobacteria bacterium]
MTTHVNFNTLSRKRRAGVLLHPTSLPESLGNGDLGHQAYRFIEFLNTCGFKVWQMLPLGPTHDDKSPYQCLSAHAGNPLLISLDWLEDRGWLVREKIDVTETAGNYRLFCLKQAAENFYQINDKSWMERISGFSREHANWLDDYALFIALKNKYQNQPWYDWPVPVRHREVTALDEASRELQATIKQTIFEQFVFFTQWHELHDYAKRYEIELFGDMPIFVAKDSADVWAQRKNFLMNEDGEMAYVAGVPPDAFSDTGQRWGNPLYDWEYMRATSFSWWKERFNTQLKLFDMIRIDHFRGLQACWQIPGDEETAINGKWVEVPGRELLLELFDTFHYLPLIAEDLGVITDEVIELKESFNLPGMKVLQFAFDGNTDNPHLPHRHKISDLIYTGTHDNDTTLGWANDEENYNKPFFEEYTGRNIESAEQGAWSMIRLAMSSVSFLCMLPMQDLLMLDSSARMNIPGTVGGNWLWRLGLEKVKAKRIEKISRLITLYQR